MTVTDYGLQQQAALWQVWCPSTEARLDALVP